jgi:hypothetical protein
VIQDERRHFAFYRAQAKARMERSARARKLVRWGLTHLWTPVGAGVKSEEEVDALCLYLLGDSPEGREHARGIDQTISEMPGLEGLTIIEDYLAAAERRAAERPGWAGIRPVPRGTASEPSPDHWIPSEERRRDVMPATSEVERREEAKMATRLAGSGSESEPSSDQNGDGA